VQRAVVSKKDLDAAVLGPESIAGEERHVRWCRLSLTVAFEDGRSVNERDVRGRIRSDTLRIECVRCLRNCRARH